VLAGCGSSGTPATSASASKASASRELRPHTTGNEPRVLSPAEASQKVSRASIPLGSEAKLSSGYIDNQFTCAGADISPPMVWQGVPPSAKEVIVVVRTLATGHLATNWVVAGIKPTAVGLEPGHPPRGAIVGKNTFGETGYHLCPPKGRPALIVFGMWASPHRLHLHPGFSQSEISSVVGSPEANWGSLLLHWR
jgi:hypothetical protein